MPGWAEICLHLKILGGPIDGVQIPVFNMTGSAHMPSAYASCRILFFDRTGSVHLSCWILFVNMTGSAHLFCRMLFFNSPSAHLQINVGLPQRWAGTDPCWHPD